MSKADMLRPVRFGSGKAEYISVRTINTLTQVRKEFDPSEIDDMSESMTLLPDGTFRLINAIGVAHLTSDDGAKRYLDEVNTFWDSNHDFGELMPIEGTDSKYNILTDGERRLRGARRKMSVLAIKDALVTASLDIDPSLVDTFPRQFLENNARSPIPPAQDASALRSYLEFIRKINSSATNVEVAKRFGISSTKFYDAATFTDYPESLRSQVDSFPYTWIVKAKPVFETAHTFYEEFAKNPDKYPHIGEDVRMALDAGGVDELAAHEATSWLIMRKAEQVRRRQKEYHRSMDPRSYAQKMDEEMRDGTLFDVFDMGSRQLPVSGEPLAHAGENFMGDGRRARAVDALATAAYDALALAYMFGFSPNEAQSAATRRRMS